VTVANAYRDAQTIKGQGDAQAASAYGEAFGKDPQFAQFYRSLEACKQAFNKKGDLMVVDPATADPCRALHNNSPSTPAARK